MAVERDCAAGIEVVEENEMLGQGVMIRCNIAAVHDELLVSIAFRNVAENLDVGAVFLDDQEHMPYTQLR
jgi:hypothetical protein